MNRFKLGQRRMGGSARRGFTLLEMMLVVVIIGLLATVVVVNMAGNTTKARRNLTKARIAQIKSALTEYNIDQGTYPPTLDLLVTTGKGYLDKVPKDDWKRLLMYSFPGSNSNDPKRPYDLFSLGEDGLSSTPDDIDVWTMDDN